MILVQPETVLRWHRRGWKYYWRLKSKSKPGRRRIALKLRSLIQQMTKQNPLWGQIRIWAELLGLGLIVSPRTVAKYMKRPRRRPPPSRRWKEFLEQHAKDIWACDFLTVRTLTFKTLYVFFLIHHSTREIVLARVTRHPTAIWSGRQLVNACWDRDPPRFLLRDNDAIYGQTFRETVKALGIHELRTPIRAPKANGIAERLVGTLRRECLDHVFIFNERHLQKVVDEYVDYYNRHRPHQGLDHQSPNAFANDKSTTPTGPPTGEILALPVLGGLHHIYKRAA